MCHKYAYSSISASTGTIKPSRKALKRRVTGAKSTQMFIKPATTNTTGKTKNVSCMPL